MDLQLIPPPGEPTLRVSMSLKEARWLAGALKRAKAEGPWDAETTRWIINFIQDIEKRAPTQ